MKWPNRLSGVLVRMKGESRKFNFICFVLLQKEHLVWGNKRWDESLDPHVLVCLKIGRAHV